MNLPGILHIDTGNSFRGGQRQLLLMVEELNRLGHNQTIALPEYCELRKRINDIPIISLSSIPLVRKLFIGKLKGIIKERHISIIHAHSSEAHTIGMRLKIINPDIKLVVTRRVIFSPSSGISRKYKYGRYVNSYIAVSKAAADSLIEAGVDSSIVEIIHSSLDINRIINERAKWDSRAVIPERYRKLVISAGALTKEKDYETAILAIHKVSQEIPEIGFIILGEGPQRRKLEKLIEKLAIDNIFLLGHREPMTPFLKACSVFMLTSQSEGLNNSAIEAAACGLPLVVSKVGGLPEIAEEDYNGILCQPGDTLGFAKAIIHLLKNDKARIKMGENSIIKSTKFEISKNVEKIADLYKRLLAR